MGHSMGGHGTYIFIQLDTTYFAAAAPSAGSGLKRTGDFIAAEKIKDTPIWAFHGDKDGVCPYERDRRVFEDVKKLGGNMKLTTWRGDNHGVSGKMIPGAENGKTEVSSRRCNDEPDFMTWMFSQSRSLADFDEQTDEIDELLRRVSDTSNSQQLQREATYLRKTIVNLQQLKGIRGQLLGLPTSATERRSELQTTANILHAQIEADEEFIELLNRIMNAAEKNVADMTAELGELKTELEALRRESGLKMPPKTDASHTSSERPNTAGPLTSGEYFITQTWSQEHSFRRPYFVNVPAGDSDEKLPVFIFLHGNGGNAQKAMQGWLRNRRQIASRYIMVFAQGYRESWNIVSERSKADDLGFIEAIVQEIAQRKNVAAMDFTIMGASNGAALVNQMAIESRLPNVRNYISGVSPLNVWQHDGKNFKAKGDDNNYRVTATPLTGKRLLNISGTKDKLVPYTGGPSDVIPAKDGKLAFVHAEESTYLWAAAMGYKGDRLREPTSTRGNIDFFRYLDGNVIHCRVNNVGHGATHEISEETLLNFLQVQPHSQD